MICHIISYHISAVGVYSDWWLLLGQVVVDEGRVLPEIQLHKGDPAVIQEGSRLSGTGRGKRAD